MLIDIIIIMIELYMQMNPEVSGALLRKNIAKKNVYDFKIIFVAGSSC